MTPPITTSQGTTKGKLDDSLILAFDVGGTKIHGGLYDPSNQQVIKSALRDTPNFLCSPQSSREDLLSALWTVVKNLGDDLLASRKPSSVVVAFPGPVTSEGVALRAPTILGHVLDTTVSVKADTGSLWPDSEVIVINDVTAAGYHYVAAGFKDFCVITVGSGIGNKVFLGGAPVVGAFGHGGEIGHLRPMLNQEVQLHASQVEIGNIASGRGLANLYKSYAESGSVQISKSYSIALSENQSSVLTELVEMFLKGDPSVATLVRTGTAPLAYALAVVHLALGIELFFITGGMAVALGERYRLLLTELLRSFVWDVGQNWDEMFTLADESRNIALSGAGYYGSLLYQAKPRL